MFFVIPSDTELIQLHVSSSVPLEASSAIPLEAIPAVPLQAAPAVPLEDFSAVPLEDAPTVPLGTGLDVPLETVPKPLIRRRGAHFTRMIGKAYEARRRNKDDYSIIVRGKRVIVERNKTCHNKVHCKQCAMITDCDREELFQSFWKMNLDQRKVYVCSMVPCHSVARRTSPHGCSTPRPRRNFTMKYHFRVKGEMMQVCKPFFLGTLDIGEWCIRSWALRGSDHNAISPKKTLTRIPDEKTKEINESLSKFFNELPKMESHYCRANSNKIYLEPVFRSFADLNEQYKYTVIKIRCPLHHYPNAGIISKKKIIPSINQRRTSVTFVQHIMLAMLMMICTIII